MRPLLALLLPLLAMDPPRPVKPELERLETQASAPGFLVLAEDFADPNSWKELLALPRRVDLSDQVGVEEGRLWLGTKGPRMSFEAPFQGLDAVRQFAMEVTLDPGDGVATILLGIEPDGTRFRLDFREGPTFSVGETGPRGARFLLEPKPHRALRSYPARVGLLRTEERLWVWSRGALLASLKRESPETGEPSRSAPSRVGLQVSSGPGSGARVFFDDLLVRALVAETRLTGFVLDAPQGSAVAGVSVLCSWPGATRIHAAASGEDGSFVLPTPIGPLLKVWTSLPETGIGWVQVAWPPGPGVDPPELLVPPSQERRLELRHPAEPLLRFSRTGLPELPREAPESRPASRPAESRPESQPAESRPASQPVESRPSGG